MDRNLNGRYAIYEHYQEGEGFTVRNNYRLITTRDVLSEAKDAADGVKQERAKNPTQGEIFQKVEVKDAARRVYYESVA